MSDRVPTVSAPNADPMHPAAIAARVERWRTAGPQGPMTLEVYPTLRCNLDCSFCDTTDRHRPPVDELSPQRWLQLIDEAHALGVRRVFILGGGEPLARRDVTPALMKRVKAHKMQGILTTNGTLMDESLTRQMVETRWDEVHFSIDGPSPEIHDRLRGQAGAFKKVVQAACRLAVRKRQRGISEPRIALHFVLTNLNWQTLPEMIRLAHGLDAFRVDFDALIAYTPEQQRLKLREAELRQVPSIAAEAAELAHQLGIETTLEHFLEPDRIERGNQPPPKPSGTGFHGAPCLKAWHHLVVQADGRVSPCCVLAGEGDTVRDTALSDVWQRDPFMETVRSSMLAGAPLARCRECSWNILSHEAVIRSYLPDHNPDAVTDP